MNWHLLRTCVEGFGAEVEEFQGPAYPVVCDAAGTKPFGHAEGGSSEGGYQDWPPIADGVGWTCAFTTAF